MSHEHYFKDVSNFKQIDIYVVLALFGVTDPAEQHAIKKLLLAGGRGAKDQAKDRIEAVESLLRGFTYRAQMGTDAGEYDDLLEAVVDWYGSSVMPVDTVITVEDAVVHGRGMAPVTEEEFNRAFSSKEMREGED